MKFWVFSGTRHCGLLLRCRQFSTGSSSAGGTERRSRGNLTGNEGTGPAASSIFRSDGNPASFGPIWARALYRISAGQRPDAAARTLGGVHSDRETGDRPMRGHRRGEPGLWSPCRWLPWRWGLIGFARRGRGPPDADGRRAAKAARSISGSSSTGSRVVPGCTTWIMHSQRSLSVPRSRSNAWVGRNRYLGTCFGLRYALFRAGWRRRA